MTVDKHKMLRTPNESIADLEHRVWQLEREQHHCRNVPTKVEPDIVIDEPAPPPAPAQPIPGVWIVDETNGEIYQATTTGDKPHSVFQVPGVKATANILWHHTNIVETGGGLSLVTAQYGHVEVLPVLEQWPVQHVKTEVGRYRAFLKTDDYTSGEVIWYDYETPDSPRRIDSRVAPPGGFFMPDGTIITFNEKGWPLRTFWDYTTGQWQTKEREGVVWAQQDMRDMLQDRKILNINDFPILWITPKTTDGVSSTSMFGFDMATAGAYLSAPQLTPRYHSPGTYPVDMVQDKSILYSQRYVLRNYRDDRAVQLRKGLVPDGYKIARVTSEYMGAQGPDRNGRDGVLFNTFTVGGDVIEKVLDLNTVKANASNKYSLIVDVEGAYIQ